MEREKKQVRGQTKRENENEKQRKGIIKGKGKKMERKGK